MRPLRRWLGPAVLAAATPVFGAVACAPFEDTSAPPPAEAGLADAPLTTDGALADAGPVVDAGTDAAQEPPAVGCLFRFRADQGVGLDGNPGPTVSSWENRCVASGMLPSLGPLGGAARPTLVAPPGIQFAADATKTNGPVLVSGQGAANVLRAPLTIYAAFRIHKANAAIANMLLDVVGGSSGLGLELNGGKLTFQSKLTGVAVVYSTSIAVPAPPATYFVAATLTDAAIKLHVEDPAAPPSEGIVSGPPPAIDGVTVGGSRIGNATLNGTVYELLGYSQADELEARRAVFTYLKARYQ